MSDLKKIVEELQELKKVGTNGEYDQWYVILKLAMEAMNIGVGGNPDTSGEKRALQYIHENIMSEKGGDCI